jgi:hypothetical protein
VYQRIVRQEEEKINANRKKLEKTSSPAQERAGKSDVKKSDVNQ